MTLEDVFQRIQSGLIKLEKKKGVTIMVDEEKGEYYGAEFYKLEDPPRRVSINKDSVYVEGARAWHPIYFDLLLGSKLDKEISIRAIRYRVNVNYVPLQVVDWKEGDEFATNGLELKGIRSLPALSEIRISMPFNRYMCSEIPKENRWDLDGYVEFSSFLGEFKKSFSFSAMKLKEEDWQILFPPPVAET